MERQGLILRLCTVLIKAKARRKCFWLPKCHRTMQLGDFKKIILCARGRLLKLPFFIIQRTDSNLKIETLFHGVNNVPACINFYRKCT